MNAPPDCHPSQRAYRADQKRSDLKKLYTFLTCKTNFKSIWDIDLELLKGKKKRERVMDKMRKMDREK